MKHKYVRVVDLKSGTKVEACFLLHNFQQRPKKDGSNFVTLVLKDASGKITGVMWDNFDGLTSGAIRDNDFVDVAGEVLTYNGTLQFKVSRITKADDAEVEATFFLPVSPVDHVELEKALKGLIEKITDSDLRRLVDEVFGNESFYERFKRAPSAVSMHQAYIHGLMEHTICVVKNALKLAENYPSANRSMLIAGGLLHDIGKTMEFVYEKKIAYSDVGRLLGHISMGNAMVECACQRIRDFPAAKKVLIQHMILSHHGFLEFGSPKRPKTLEAVILHHADLIDAQLSNFMESAANSAQGGPRWEFSHMFERYLMLASDQVDGSELMRDLAYPGRKGPVTEQDDATLASAVSSDDILAIITQEEAK